MICLAFHSKFLSVWTSRKKGRGLEIKITLWSRPGKTQKLRDLAEEYASFCQEAPVNIEVLQ
jgi:hypothetical protein